MAAACSSISINASALAASAMAAAAWEAPLLQPRASRVGEQHRLTGEVPPAQQGETMPERGRLIDLVGYNGAGSRVVKPAESGQIRQAKQVGLLPTGTRYKEQAEAKECSKAVRDRGGWRGHPRTSFLFKGS
jgi:hypothetical protein